MRKICIQFLKVAASKLRDVKVYLNGVLLQIDSFKKYIDLFLESDQKGKMACSRIERVKERWEVGIALCNGSSEHVTFVNSIATVHGGSHLDHITDTIANRLLKKRKTMVANGLTTIKPSDIKTRLFVFLNYLIEKPQFDDNVEVKKLKGYDCTEKFVPSGEFIDQIVDIGIFDQLDHIDRTNLGNTTNQLLNVHKLDDANFAASDQRTQCTLIIVQEN